MTNYPVNINAHFDIRDENKVLNEGEGFPFFATTGLTSNNRRSQGNPLLFFALRFAYTCARRSSQHGDSLRFSCGVASVWATGAIPHFFIDVPSSQ